MHQEVKNVPIQNRKIIFQNKILPGYLQIASKIKGFVSFKKKISFRLKKVGQNRVKKTPSQHFHFQNYLKGITG